MIGQARQTRLLLIEDNPGDVRLIQRMLAGARLGGFSIESAGNLSTGLDRLRQGDVDLVLLDLSLPDSQGISTFMRVRNERPEIPVVVMTGLDDEEVAIRAVRDTVAAQ